MNTIYLFIISVATIYVHVYFRNIYITLSMFIFFNFIGYKFFKSKKAKKEKSKKNENYDEEYKKYKKEMKKINKIKNKKYRKLQKLKLELGEENEKPIRIKIEDKYDKVPKCPLCNKSLIKRHDRWQCIDYPKCNFEQEC